VEMINKSSRVALRYARPRFHVHERDLLARTW
jgi:hypothetical protein